MGRVLKSLCANSHLFQYLWSLERLINGICEKKLKQESVKTGTSGPPHPPKVWMFLSSLMQGWVQTHVLCRETGERPQSYGGKQGTYHRPCQPMGELWASVGLCEPADDPDQGGK